MTPIHRAWPSGVEGQHGVVHVLADGTQLRSDIYRPPHAGPLPALLMRVPYDRTVAEMDTGVAHPSWLAAQGYVVVVQDVRGTGSSTGDFEPFRHEASDGVESIRWVSRLDGVDGRVLTYGSSYMGISQLLAAAERPSALRGVAPAFASSGVYDGWITESGVVNLGFLASWMLNMASSQAARDGDHAAARILGDETARVAEQPLLLASDIESLLEIEPIRQHAPWVVDWWRHRDEPAWWDEWNLEPMYRLIEVPAWHAAGVHDVFAHGTLRNFTGLRSSATTEWARESQRLVVGPWSHDPGTPTAAGPAASVNRLDELWLTWARDVLDGRSPGAAPVTIWLESHGWRGFDSWPPPAPSVHTWFLRSSGRAQSRHGDGWLDAEPAEDEPADVLLEVSSRPVPTVGGRGLGAPQWMGPQDQAAREDLRTVLVYTTPPTRSAFCIVGEVHVELVVSAHKAPANVVARLSVVDAAGSSTNLQDAVHVIRSAGNTEVIRLSLTPVTHHVQPGERLRLTLAASDDPRWERRAYPSSVMVLHNRKHRSRVQVPLQWH